MKITQCPTMPAHGYVTAQENFGKIKTNLPSIFPVHKDAFEDAINARLDREKLLKKLNS